MHAISIYRATLAFAVSLALSSPAHLRASELDTCDAAQSACADEGTSSSVWWWTGLGALGAGIAVAAGGGSGSDGGGKQPGGMPGEGGQYGDGGLLTAPGDQTVWQQHSTTRVTGRSRNEGTLQLAAGTLHISGNGELRNTGTIDARTGSFVQIDGDADLDNDGTLMLAGTLSMAGDGSLDNRGQATFSGARAMIHGEADLSNTGMMRIDGGQWAFANDADLDNGRTGQLDIHGTSLQIRDRASIENDGRISGSGLATGNALFDVVTGQWGNDRDAINALDNRGIIQLGGEGSVLRMVADTHASHAVNRRGATIESSSAHHAMLHAEGAHAILLNQGTLTVTGDGAIAMRGARGATLINDGVINLGTAHASSGRGMVAMQSDGSATLNNRRGGIINIHAADSSAFQISAGSTGRLINNGVVNIYGQGSRVHADAATAAADQPGADLGWQPRSAISGYTIGTNADGSAGQLNLHGGGTLEDVQIDSGFSRGTDASTVLLQDVIVGADGGEQHIRSNNIVWNAHAQRDVEGNIDVQLMRNDYRDLAGHDQQQLAAILEQGYHNSALYHSLELADTTQFRHALHQLSGAGLMVGTSRAMGTADALWTRLAALPADQHRMLGFTRSNAVDSRIDGNGNALQLAAPLRSGNIMQMVMATLDTGPEGAAAGERTQSHLIGMGLAQQWGALSVRHQLGHELHTLDGRRTLHWGNVLHEARSRRHLTRTLLSSTLSVTSHVGATQWQPHVSASVFSFRDAGFSEHGAQGFGLDVERGHMRGIRLEVGSQFQRAVGPRWTLRADLAAGTPLAVEQSQRKAWLQGAGDGSFGLAGMTANGLDHRAQFGAEYRMGPARVTAQMLAQRQWGQVDQRVELQFSRLFN